MVAAGHTKEVSGYMDDFEGKNVLITGGLGFIGSNLAHKLVDLNANVLIIDSLSPNGGGDIHNIDGITDKVKLEKIDVQNKKMYRFVKNQDYIFHLAAQLSHSRSMKYPQEDFEINVLCSLNLLEACRNCSSDTKIIYTGTRGQYGRIKYNPVNEKHLLQPIDVNGVSKLAAERYHLVYNKIYGIKTTAIRLTNTYGPRHQMKNSEQGFIGWFIRLAMDNKTIKIFGDGKQLRDFNYVDDVVAALLVAATNKKANSEVFNIGSGKPISVINLVKTILKIINKGKYKLIPFPEEKKRIEIGDYVADITKINEYLGWKPKTSIEDGLKKTIEFYEKNKLKYW